MNQWILSIKRLHEDELLLKGLKDGKKAVDSNESPVVAEWPNVVMYEIFVQSFVDSNGGSIGDFKGMTNKLDNLQDLGIKGVCLMPIMPSPSYHK